MDTMVSFSNILSPLMIYQLGDGELRFELSIWANELDRINRAIERLYRENFLETAESFGLSSRERVFSKERDDLSASVRRQMVKQRETLCSSDFTREGFEKALESLRAQGQITEYPALETVVVIANGNFSQAEKRWIEQQAQKLFPAHLLTEISFNSLSWAQLDAENRRFSQIDAADQSWQTLDTREAGEG